ncbi:MAG: ABC transporter permease [Planctomycetota bacterium]
MSRICVLAAKEFKSFFSSWVAYFFILVFVMASLWFFFFHAEFFGRGRAEIRGLFEWLPLTLAILVPGLTMRQWAREREMGSIELLLTLPASTSELVLGKFFGCLALVFVALLFTLGIPITASSLGDLDWGPVVGGYCAALLLGSAYIAIGLLVSSWFTDQFVALITGWMICVFMAAISHESVLFWATDISKTLADTLGFVGFWSRFDSIERGVLDFRDVAYYLSVTGLFLYLNTCRLRLQRWA